MTAGLRITEHLIETNRALEALRDAVTRAYVDASNDERRGEQEKLTDDEMKKLRDLRADIAKLRTKIYEPGLDDLLIQTVARAAVMSA